MSNEKHSAVYKIDIKVTGIGGFVSIHADKLKRDLENLGYKVNFEDPNKGNAFWKLTDEWRQKYDAVHQEEIKLLPIINFEVEQCPGGG